MLLFRSLALLALAASAPTTIALADETPETAPAPQIAPAPDPNSKPGPPALPLTGSLTAPPPLLAQDKAQQWYDTKFIGEEIVEEKRELLLTPAKALQLFQAKPPHIKPDWREKLGQPLELAPDARIIPDLKIGSAGKVEGPPFAKVTGFSRNFAQIMILQARGGYLWHNYERCLATFKVPRTKAFDEFFDLAQLEKTYGFNYKGIVYASPNGEVLKALGQPDTIEHLQKYGLYRYHYPEVIIAIDDGAVYMMTYKPKGPTK